MSIHVSWGVRRCSAVGASDGGTEEEEEEGLPSAPPPARGKRGGGDEDEEEEHVQPVRRLNTDRMEMLVREARQMLYSTSGMRWSSDRGKEKGKRGVGWLWFLVRLGVVVGVLPGCPGLSRSVRLGDARSADESCC